MEHDFKDLQSQWQDHKNNIAPPKQNMDALYSKIKAKTKANYFFYYGTLLILLMTLIGISLFFYFVAPVKELLSRIGVALMISGLLFRISIEIISIQKAKRMNALNNTLIATENTIKFHQFRKTIHNKVAPTIIILYTIGFYLITPEFSRYIEFWLLVWFNVSYVIIGIILFFVIRKGVQKEMIKINEIMKLRQEISE
jgi:hypothetical protein